MIEERAQKRFEDEVVDYERQLQDFSELKEKYEKERESNPESADLPKAFEELQRRQRQLQERFERLNAQRDIVA